MVIFGAIHLSCVVEDYVVVHELILIAFWVELRDVGLVSLVVLLFGVIWFG